MPDLHARTTIPSVQLINLRDLLQERAEHLDEWLDELTKAQVVNITAEFGDVCSDQLKYFLFELHGDLDDWARTLSDLVGRETEAPQDYKLTSPS